MTLYEHSSLCFQRVFFQSHVVLEFFIWPPEKIFHTSPSEPSRFDCNETATKGRIQEKKVLGNFDWEEGSRISINLIKKTSENE